MTSSVGKRKDGKNYTKKGLRGKPLAKNRMTFRSGLEETVAQQLTEAKIKYDYESNSSVIRYTIPASHHSYTPDFVVTTRSGKIIIIETKGIWDYEDRYKHLLIRQQHPELDIRFVFQRPLARLKRGSTTTYRDICEGRGRGIFKGYTWPWAGKRIPDIWLEE